MALLKTGRASALKQSDEAAPAHYGEYEGQTQCLDYVARSGLAGGTAGCAAKTLIAPLDRVKILFQTRNPEFMRFSGSILGLEKAMRYIVSSEGLLGLYRGHSATLLRVFPYAGVKFVAYEQFRALLIRSTQEETPVRRFMAGSLSGVASVFVTYPLDVIRVQLAYNTHTGLARHSLLHTIRNIAFQEGGKPGHFNMGNFYSGFVPTLLGMIPYAGVSFLAHDYCHDLFRTNLLAPYAVNNNAESPRTGRHPLNNWAELCAGGLSGLMAQTASYPLEIVRRRMQVSGITKQRLSILGTIATVYAESGLRGFFVGLSIGYIKVVPMFACSFFVYEKMKYLLGI